jgi:outer membrane protein TolC
MLKRKRLLLLLLLGFQIQQIYPQVFISLQTALSEGEEKNQQIKQSHLQTKISKSEHRQANATFLPKVEMSYNALYTNNPLNAFGFKLNQRSVKQEDFAPSLLNHPKSSSDYAAAIHLQQPLVNLDAIWSRKAAKDAYKAQQYMNLRTKEGVLFQIQKTYLEIGLSYKNVKVLQKAAATAEAFEKRAQGMFNEGIIQQADLLEAKAYHLKIKAELQTAKSEILNTSDRLSLLIGRTTGTQYQVEEISWNYIPASHLNLKERNDLKAYHAKLAATDKIHHSHIMSWFPRLNAFANFQYNDNKFGKLRENSYLVGVSLSWTLFNGNQRIQKIKQSKLQREKIKAEIAYTTEKATSEYEKAKRMLHDLETNLVFTNEMVNQAQEAWRVQQNRYTEGLSPTSDLLRIQAKLAQQELKREFILFQKNYTIAYLQFLNRH